MRVAVFGATGNIGLATVRALAADPAVTSIVGAARRIPPLTIPKVEWRAVDIATDDIGLAETDAVVHLAWKLQPQHRPTDQLATNVHGTRRLLAAVVRHHVPVLVCASSVGAYAPGPKTHGDDGSWTKVDESWPATGVASSGYSSQKAIVETLLDELESAHPQVRVARMRTSLVFQRAAAAEIHRLFLGPLAPWHLPSPLRLIPAVDGLVFQATHADDIANAYRLAVTTEARGAFNVAAEPVLTPQVIAAAVGGRTIPVPARLLRSVVHATFSLRLQPTEPGWIDMARAIPLMDVSRAHDVLGWRPTRDATDVISELVGGIGDGAGEATDPLQPRRRRWTARR